MKKTVLISMCFTILALLPSVSHARSGVNSPDFWIKKLKGPDAPVLQPEGIKALNKSILDKSEYMADLSGFPEVISGPKLLEWVLMDPMPAPGKKRWGADGKAIGRDFYSALLDNMKIEGIREVNAARFGVMVDRADVRAFPTDSKVLKNPGRREFDTFQYSSIYPAEKVVLLHTSRDNVWGFCQTDSVRGWIRLDKIAFGEKATINLDQTDTLVVTGSRVPVYADQGLKTELAWVPMGTGLMLAGTEARTDGLWTVRFPRRLQDGGVLWVNAFISAKADVNRGYLPYTRKNVITQAFKMLGEEYGWGGIEGRRDCSIFIKDLFATMGVKLPRNSGQQALAGFVKASTEESTRKELAAALKKASPGITVLGLKGHIMLYLGAANGKPFVIHQVFGYMDGKTLKVLNKVAVTGLDLGSHSRIGPMKNRIMCITEIMPVQGI